MISLAGVVGVAFIAGAIALLSWAVDARRPVLADRVRTAVSPGAPPARTAWQRLAAGATAGLEAAFERVSSREVVGGRLARAGWRMSIDTFRILQAAATTGGALAGATCWLAAGASAGLGVPLVAVAGVSGFLACDQLLTRAVAARGRRLTAEFPAVAELLAFAVAAGESAVSALRRVVSASNGELVGELSVVLAEVRSGASLTSALGRLAERLDVPAIRRFVDGLVVAVDRGTPLADVLRAQAGDARAFGQRQLVESAARREVFMLVPVVFLILPTVVVVALYPGLQSLNLTVP